MTVPPLIIVASLPGAGGAVLQAIFNQDPRLFPLIRSPLFEFIHGIHTIASQSKVAGEGKSFAERSIGSLLHAAQDIAPGKVVVDKTGTGPLEYLDLIQRELPAVKVVLVVRDLRAQAASLVLRSLDERLTEWLRTAGTVPFKEIERVFQIPAMQIGLRRIGEMISSSARRRIFILPFEQLCLSPHASLKLLYDYFEMPVPAFQFDTLLPLPESRNLSSQGPAPEIRPVLEDLGSRWLNAFSHDDAWRIVSHFKEYFAYFYPQVFAEDPRHLRTSTEQQQG